MKVLLSILVFLQTAVYLLPVKQLVAESYVGGIALYDGEIVKESKKENPKPVIAFLSFTQKKISTQYSNQLISCNQYPQISKKVESPPPDSV